MIIKNQKKLTFQISYLIIIFTLLYSCDVTEPLFDKYSTSGTYLISWNNIPKLGSDDNLRLGGFVGLFYKNNRTFYTVTNRGPVSQKLDENGAIVNFIDPTFVPKIIELELQDNNTIKVVNQIAIKRPGGFNTSGLLLSNSWNSDEAVTNSNFGQDDWGIYPGGILMDITNNYFWISDQYNPALMKVTANGEWVQRLKPNEGFRRALSNHTVNGGFAGIDFWGQESFVTLNARCLERNFNPDEKAGSVNYRMRRVTTYNLKTNTDLSMLYYVKPESYDGIPERFVQLGDIACVNDTSFLVTEFANYNGIERNLLYLVSTDDSTTKAPIGLEGILGKTIETLSAKEIRVNKIKPMNKLLLYDLSLTNIKRPEGIAIIDKSHIAVIDNNRFGIVNDDPVSASYTLEKNPIYLEIITLPTNLDLSKRAGF